MRPLPLLLAATAAGLLAAAGASAQDAPQTTPPPAAAPPTTTSAPLGSPENPIVQSSPTPPEQAFHLKAGDPNVVSNPPVPDTPQNRAAYGQPMSQTGKRTSASGN